jgi:hypothetical protein
METWDAIRARRNVRQYTSQPIARENLERIVEAGRRHHQRETGSRGTSWSSPAAGS